MTRGMPYRGQPLLALMVLLAGWIALRIATWAAPGIPQPGAPPELVRTAVDAVATVADLRQQETGTLGRSFTGARGPLPSFWPRHVDPPGGPIGVAGQQQAAADDAPASAIAIQRAAIPLADSRPFTPAARAFSVPPAARPAPTSRWSADGWMLLRRDTTTAVTSGRGSYGASQLGGVVRFSLVPESGFRPQAYLRASQALAGAGESEAAVGLSARPYPGVPLRLAAELRATVAAGTATLRPAAYVVTELPPQRLPFGITAEAYAQAGYVGGNDATAFADGQLRAEREFAQFGRSSLRLGGGAWGGAQRGVSRLDVGPGATLALDLGKASSRLSLDWRFRVAGEANPANGPVLTISAGF